MKMYRTRNRRDRKGKRKGQRTACGICCDIVGPPTIKSDMNREEQRLTASTKT